MSDNDQPTPWNVNPTTLEFEGLTSAQRSELRDICINIVRHGKVDFHHPAFQAWVRAGNFDDRQALLCLSTAFPQKALLSIVVSETVPEESHRPDFAGFAESLDREIRWVGELHERDKTGQAASDQRHLRELATKVRQVGANLGFV